MSRLRLIVATAVALVLLLPATVLAASVEMSGTVTDKEGAAVAGATITIRVEGDIAFETTSDENGAWAIAIEVGADPDVEVSAEGPTVTIGPDGDGCTTSTTSTGRTTVTLPAEGAPAPVALALDQEVSGTVCAETAKPEKTPKPDSPQKAVSPARPALTPPATDTIEAAGASSTGTGMLLLLGGLAAFVALTAALSARRR
ncbi:MAG TPA: carboxypeptidase-like regulatory domain-containing protein [Candidatus Limnocylindrales bacterium]|nr:carboxypeptidase-like regulatory domain-containing protein [Candidatus Limnocylindrales bacterium]